MNPLDFILHSDRKLIELVATYGSWVYGILFAIVFAETGFVVTPFLPGDSLLFATGALCATGALSTPVAVGLLILAAFTGNAVNYTVGRLIGPRVFTATDRSGLFHRLLNRENLQRAHGFFEEYGGKAIILGRFVPIVRTFVPFVAGAAARRSHQFSMIFAIDRSELPFSKRSARPAWSSVPIPISVSSCCSRHCRRCSW